MERGLEGKRHHTESRAATLTNRWCLENGRLHVERRPPNHILRTNILKIGKPAGHLRYKSNPQWLRGYLYSDDGGEDVKMMLSMSQTTLAMIRVRLYVLGRTSLQYSVPNTLWIETHSHHEKCPFTNLLFRTGVQKHRKQAQPFTCLLLLIICHQLTASCDHHLPISASSPISTSPR